MRFIKATLLTTNLLLLATSLYWTTTSWLDRTPTFSARPCTLVKKLITRSKRFYRTEFLVTLHLETSDPPALPPVTAFRYASPVYNQTFSQASEFLSRYNISSNYICFINVPKHVHHHTHISPTRYVISMTYPSHVSHAWLATLFSLVALVALLIQLVFIRVPVSVSPPTHVVMPPPRVGLSHERVREVCVECTVEECAICLEDETGCKGARLPCGHAFHKICLDRWLVRGRVCPLCNCDLGKIVVTKWRRIESKSGEQRQGDEPMRDEDARERMTSAEQNASRDGEDGEDGEMTGLGNVRRRRKSSQRDTVELD